jgi:hypothetical protein
MSIMSLYTIYDHPSDFPDAIVVRRFTVDVACGLVPTGDRWNCKDLDSARAVVRDLLPGAVCFPRWAEDDPVILETWL